MRGTGNSIRRASDWYESASGGPCPQIYGGVNTLHMEEEGKGGESFSDEKSYWKGRKE